MFSFFASEIITAETNTMYYKGVYLDLDIANVDDKTAGMIKTSIDAKVAQTPCVKNSRCKHIKTEVVADDDNTDRKKRGVQSASVVVYVSCDLVTGMVQFNKLVKTVNLTMFVDSRAHKSTLYLP